MDSAQGSLWTLHKGLGDLGMQVGEGHGRVNGYFIADE